MLRLIFWIAVIFAAVWVWRRMKARPPRQEAPPFEPAASPMVRCAQCGVHVPQAEALPSAQRWYCSQAHLEQGKASGEH